MRDDLVTAKLDGQPKPILSPALAAAIVQSRLVAMIAAADRAAAPTAPPEILAGIISKRRR